MFCLLAILVKLSACQVARKTPLRKPNHGEGLSPESPGRRVLMIFLVYCIVSLFYYVSVVSWPYGIYFPTPMARYSLIVLKVLLNTKQTNKQLTSTSEVIIWHCRNLINFIFNSGFRHPESGLYLDHCQKLNISSFSTGYCHTKFPGGMSTDFLHTCTQITEPCSILLKVRKTFNYLSPASLQSSE